MRSQRRDWLSWTPMLMACRLRVNGCHIPYSFHNDMCQPGRKCSLVHSKQDAHRSKPAWAQPSSQPHADCTMCPG